MPILVPDSEGAGPQLFCWLGASRPPIFPGCTQGVYGTNSSERRTGEPWLLPWPTDLSSSLCWPQKHTPTPSLAVLGIWAT